MSWIDRLHDCVLILWNNICLSASSVDKLLEIEAVAKCPVKHMFTRMPAHTLYVDHIIYRNKKKQENTCSTVVKVSIHVARHVQ